MTDRLEQLVRMTRSLGEPHRHYVIIGEGNTSCKIDDGGLWIKASGYQMETIDAGGFLAVNSEPILAMLDNPPPDLAAEMTIRNAARRDSSSTLHPSQEVSFHAMLMHECGVQFVGHTHPTAINGIMTSNRAEQFAHKRLFPDHVVVCGMDSALVPYCDPGLTLAIGMRDQVRDYMQRYGEAPRTILLKNHGLVALGQTADEVLNITAMSVKAATIFTAACATGEPVFLPDEDVFHLDKRPDERYRRNLFAGSG
jgi:rhamnose utilization protein RhaD (predicted bifunctional aldolase and dehydrogenase)